MDQCRPAVGGDGLIGLKGSPTQMADLLVRRKVRQGLRLEGSPEEIARLLADKIQSTGCDLNPASLI